MKLGGLERDTLLYAAGKAIAGGAGIVTLLALTRTLGVQDYGKLSLWIVAATWISQAGSGWLRQSILRFSAGFQAGTELEPYRATVQLLSLASTGACVVAMALGATVVEDASWVRQAAAVFLTGTMAWWNIQLTHLQAGLRSRAAVVTDLVRAVAPLPLILLARFAGVLSVEVALVLTALPTAVAAVLARTNTSSSIRKIRASLSRPIVRRLATFGLPMGAWFLLSSGHVLVGRLALEHGGSAHALGLFSAVQDVVSRGLGLMFMPMTLALHTHVMSLWAEGRSHDASRAIAKAYVYLGAAGLLCTALVVGLGPWLPQLLFDSPASGPSETVALTIIVAAAALATQAGLVAHKGLELRERTQRMVVFMAIGLLLNALISFLTLPRLGVYGPAIGSLIGNLSYFLLAHAGSRRALRSGTSHDS